MQRAPGRFTEVFLRVFPWAAAPMSQLFIYISNFSVKHFPHLLNQTRYGDICLARYLEKILGATTGETGRARWSWDE
ncbi:MAG: hypothetical protein DMG39_15415 [Acidobacteria bacterium]|nr:MAG: hypothetical protein DMG39_15415 [Acidobacteriota bacterium]